MKVQFFTLGCKVNTYETEAMKQQLLSAGYELTEKVADIYIVNTCSVTNIAERKSRQMLRRAKELNPNAIIMPISAKTGDGMEQFVTWLADERKKLTEKI